MRGDRSRRQASACQTSTSRLALWIVPVAMAVPADGHPAFPVRLLGLSASW